MQAIQRVSVPGTERKLRARERLPAGIMLP